MTDQKSPLEALIRSTQSGDATLCKKPETHKGLKRVTLICLLCPMLVIIHFEKYHIWNENKR